ncbi:hypothetical protein QJS10_CPB14g00589 [Acorus calamus]|uniref:Uncharacterized protein n=1 Tax=Acorus calamus TaxID=4465 RepID=A0AAV9DBT6_ACOCL|nr:hypothetical protein QJS10_CPB14g00589 [Acorus calamus]
MADFPEVLVDQTSYLSASRKTKFPSSVSCRVEFSVTGLLGFADHTTCGVTVVDEMSDRPFVWTMKMENTKVSQVPLQKKPQAKDRPYVGRLDLRMALTEDPSLKLTEWGMETGLLVQIVGGTALGNESAGWSEDCQTIWSSWLERTKFPVLVRFIIAMDLPDVSVDQTKDPSASRRIRSPPFVNWMVAFSFTVLFVSACHSKDWPSLRVQNMFNDKSKPILRMAKVNP